MSEETLTGMKKI